VRLFSKNNNLARFLDVMSISEIFSHFPQLHKCHPLADRRAPACRQAGIRECIDKDFFISISPLFEISWECAVWVGFREMKQRKMRYLKILAIAIILR